MLNPSTRLIGLVVMTCLLFSGCSSTPTRSQQTTASPAMEADFAQALEYMQTANWAGAMDILEGLAVQNERLPGVWLNLGIARSKLGDSDNAITALEQAVQLDPANAIAHNQLGIVYRQAGDLVRAEQQYEESLGADSRLADAHWNLAMLYELYLHEPARALHHYQEYQQLTGSDDQRLSISIAGLKEQVQPATITAGVR
jgi:Tfp pilus assembly protein PilF